MILKILLVLFVCPAFAVHNSLSELSLGLDRIAADDAEECEFLLKSDKILEKLDKLPKTGASYQIVELLLKNGETITATVQNGFIVSHQPPTIKEADVADVIKVYNRDMETIWPGQSLIK
jgi:hypothetical protein